MRPLKRQLTAEMELEKDTGPAKKVFPRLRDSALGLLGNHSTWEKPFGQALYFGVQMKS